MIHSVRRLRARRVFWYARRASQMSPGEVLHRVGETARKVAWRGRRGETELPARTRSSGISRVERLDLSDGACDRVGPDARLSLTDAAERLLAGEWRLFGETIDGLGPEVDWFSDPRTGLRGFDRSYCFDVPYRDEHLIGNVKFLWEVSRHQHLTALAAAYRLSGDARYAERIQDHLRSWWKANPFLTGVNWCSGIEVGIRLISWTWIRRLLAGWPGVTALFERNDAFLAQLFRHQQFLSTFRSRGSSANNHLIAEAAGLFVASAAFPLFEESDRWRSRSAIILEREIRLQTDAQGLNRELATDYHGFVLELLLAAGAEGDAGGAPFSDGYWLRVRSMMDALAAIMDADGRPPRQGDTDDGLGLLLDAPGFDRWASLLATGADLFGALSWWQPRREPDVRAAALAALATPRRHLGERPARRPSSFDEAGLVILRDDAEADAPELWCRCDHGPHGFLSIAAHAHADALSIELRHGGVDVLADPGTYCYHGETEWRRYFRSARGHNVLELGGIDQAVDAGPFLWLTRPASRLHFLAGVEEGAQAIWHASHDGYARRLGATVHRRVALVRGQGRVLIEDWVDGEKLQRARLFFHLGPSIRCSLDGDVAHLRWSVRGRAFEGRLQLPRQLAWTVHCGDDEGGWYSAGFGRKCPAVTLVGGGTAVPNVRFVSALFVSQAQSEASDVNASGADTGNGISPRRETRKRCRIRPGPVRFPILPMKPDLGEDHEP